MLDISVGLDLATSASIVGASIAYVMSERKRRTSERQWRLELTAQKQVELSQSIVNDVLEFMPIITATGRRIHRAVQEQPLALKDGTELATPAGIAQSICDEFSELRDKIEFELLRPLEVKVDFFDGQAVWDREAARCRAKLDIAEQAMKTLVKVCSDPIESADAKRMLLQQAMPFLYASEPIGGKIDSVYSALIALANDLKRGLLAIQPA